MDGDTVKREGESSDPVIWQSRIPRRDTAREHPAVVTFFESEDKSQAICGRRLLVIPAV